MSFNKGIFSFFLISIFTSCISYRYIDLQVLNPGSVKLPSNITLHITDPQKIDSDHLLSFRDTTLNKLYYYKLLIHTFDSTLKARFIESPMFENSQIVIQTEDAFQKEMVNKTFMEKKRHIFMSISKMDVIEKRIEVSYDDWNYWYMASYSITYKFKIELQNTGNEHYYDTSLFTDTLTWTSNSYNKELLGRDLPTRTEAICEVGSMAAERYAKKVAPFWNTEERMLYYSGNKYMRKGYNQYLANDLEGAIQSWKHLYEVGTPQLASIAAHNIGLMYEMLDDFENSELWLNNSLKLRNHYQTVDYLYRVQERNTGRKKLDEQMIQP